MIVPFAVCPRHTGQEPGVDSELCGLGETGRGGSGQSGRSCLTGSTLGQVPSQLEMAPGAKKRRKVVWWTGCHVGSMPG